MQFVHLRIRNYKVIRDMEIRDMENALILVGKNNTGKTSVLDAIRVVSGAEELKKADFNEVKQNVEIEVTLEITQEGAAFRFSWKNTIPRSMTVTAPFSGSQL